MNVQAVTLNLPEVVYQHAELAARSLKRPLEEVLVETPATSLPQLSLSDDAPAEMAGEIAAMAGLSDEALLGLANSLLPAERQAAVNRLLDRQGRGELDQAGEQELASLTAECGRHLLRRAKAVALLMARGRPAPELLPFPLEA
ncbi:MAG TPA: hypothetical protein PLD20_07945 [Blastocatellia bacterium]|nr:hypothetical protein [Blastocatellia bacterium]HMY73576.1 hypothetical protein [Blastocatellia bacterium]HMZ17845.1 hypothetical protein [Blastocatellia bacterium]HNG29705.1 hypothetical protein [Blastocatellia bacterium]